MPVSREVLTLRLKQLEADMPGLIEAHPDHADFNPICAERADEITDEAGPEDHDWAFEQIDAILEKYGLWRPDQESLPPDE